MTENRLNLFKELPPPGAPDESFVDLLSVEGLRIERIVSQGHVSPPGFWYEQEWDEWVLLMQGEAHLEIQGESRPRRLMAGDHAWLPARCRHRVVFTSSIPPAMWLAVHRGVSPDASPGQNCG